MQHSTELRFALCLVVSCSGALERGELGRVLLQPLQAKLVPPYSRPPTERFEEVQETQLLDGLNPKKCVVLGSECPSCVTAFCGGEP